MTYKIYQNWGVATNFIEKSVRKTLKKLPVVWQPGWLALSAAHQSSTVEQMLERDWARASLSSVQLGQGQGSSCGPWWWPFHAGHEPPAVIFHTCTLRGSGQDSKDGGGKKQGDLSWPHVHWSVPWKYIHYWYRLGLWSPLCLSSSPFLLVWMEQIIHDIASLSLDFVSQYAP